MNDAWKLSVTELAAAYRTGRTDPVAVIAEYRARIARIDPKLNCYVALNPDLDKEVAESASRLRSGRPRSALEGVPIAVKDNLVVRGMPASWGSAVFADRGICDTDELPIARLRAAGAVILGKTNTPEFAVEGYTSNQLFGTTGNAWNPALTPGGSSGGSVSAVAAGLAAVAIGTDGGGSIRRPSGYTGLCGLKPTIGSVPRSGGLPQVLLDFEVVGAMARDVADLKLVYDVMAGSDRADPMSRRRADLSAPRENLRILYVPLLSENPCDPCILSRCDAAADVLRKMGHQVTKGALPFNLEALGAFWGKFGQIGLAQMRAALPEMAQKASQKYLDMANLGAAVPAMDLYAALDHVRELRAATSLFFADWDAILMPSSAAQPWDADQPFPPKINGQDVGPRGHAIYTGWVNAAGLPALNLPAKRHDDGMPVGFQVIGDMFAEDMLLNLGADYEAANGGWVWPEWLSHD